MSLTRQEVEHVAKLARLRLSDEELEHVGTQLSSILDYVDMIQEINLEGVPPTAQVTGLTSVMRPDEVHQTLSREEALQNAAVQQDGMFRVKAVFEE
jgi:aspartyl-tRNA(Asn)/glutamyl-tRNA(Gln) amidotransferase subunit C